MNPTNNYSYLSEVFPNFYKNSTFKKVEIELNKHNNETPPTYNENEDLKHLSLNLKEYEKLRIVDDNLIVDTRYFKSFKRKMSGDQRLKVLEKLDTYKKSYYKTKILKILATTTYKNDPKFIKKCEEMGLYLSSKNFV